jgi:1-acyl-sn-glycerol-3-phosphate acyltransferase
MSSWIKVIVGLVFLAIATTVHSLLLLVLFPSRNLRIRSCNYWGWVVGRSMLWLTGSRVSVTGMEHFDGDRPAIYVSNHTSSLDIFLGIWLAPVGTVGVAKKEVVYYPFFGQLYWLSGHLRIDRGNHERAMAAMRDLENAVRDYGLSIWMWPEGTRSKDGVLLPFRKGLWHLAKATGLPIVPVVVSNAHRVWEKGRIQINAVPVTVTALPAIDTTDWAERDILECLEEVHVAFRDHLPADQLPAEAPAA